MQFFENIFSGFKTYASYKRKNDMNREFYGLSASFLLLSHHDTERVEWYWRMSVQLYIIYKVIYKLYYDTGRFKPASL